ncbi:MAG: hypothetical protein ACTSQK_04285 [Candidatus Heimdallarchaeota archaeon]
MTMPLEKTRDKTYITIMLVAIFFCSICIGFIPFTNSIWDDGAITWHKFTWSIGGWYQYDRIDDNAFDNIGGFYDSTDGYSVAIIILFLIAIALPLIAVFLIGKNKWQSFTFQRVFASIIALGAVAGILATIFFGLFYSKQTVDPTMKFYIGFYIAAIYYPCLLIASIKPIVTSNQKPKPVITPGPPQEGQLFPEKKKDAMRRQLFHHVDDIKEEIKEDL